MKATLSLVENLYGNALHHPSNQVLVERHRVHPGCLYKGNEEYTDFTVTSS